MSLNTRAKAKREKNCKNTTPAPLFIGDGNIKHCGFTRRERVAEEAQNR
jgi:hypothetical protein